MPANESRNGFGRHLGTAVNVAILLAMLVSVVLWGLKIETELNIERERNVTQSERLAEVRSALHSIREAGILPRADERIEDLERRVDELEDSQ